jgi:hypothetical protein
MLRTVCLRNFNIAKQKNLLLRIRIPNMYSVFEFKKPRQCGFHREDAMLKVSRRSLLKSAVGVVAAGSLLKSPAVLAQVAPLKLKFGNDLPATHSVNVRLKEAIEAIDAETKGQLAINLFPNNQLGSDTDSCVRARSSLPPCPARCSRP